MELIGEVAIAAPRERVWAALNDSQVLRACIPGCEEIVDESPTVRKARVMVKVGPVRARFSGTITLAELQAPQRCVLGFEGSGGAAGMASGRSQVELHEEGAGTRVNYAVKAAVGGKLGQIGGRMIDASAKQLADQFFQAFRQHLAPESPPATPVEVPAPVATQRAGAAPVEMPAAAHAAAAAAASGEGGRVLWFLLGVASTALGVWLGKLLF
jgi:hypothetical protein